MEIPQDENIFMICEALDARVWAALPGGYHFRTCREDELGTWMAFPFDDPSDAQKYQSFMKDFFERVYSAQKELFFQRCVFACDSSDRPVGTVMIWKIYGAITSIHCTSESLHEGPQTFGLSGARVGSRSNDIEAATPFLSRRLRSGTLKAPRVALPKHFIQILKGETDPQF